MQCFESNKDYIELTESELNSVSGQKVKFDISRRNEREIFDKSITVWGNYDKSGKYLYPFQYCDRVEKSPIKEKLYLNYSIVYHCTRWLKNFLYSSSFIVTEGLFDTIYLDPFILNQMFQDVNFDYPDWDYYFKDFRQNPLSCFVLSSSSYNEDDNCCYPHYLLVHQNKPIWYTSYFERENEPKYVKRAVDGFIFTFNHIGCIRAFKGREYYKDAARGLYEDYLAEGKIEDKKYFSMKVKDKGQVKQSMWDYDEMMIKLSQLTREVDYDDSIVYKETIGNSINDKTLVIV